MEIPYYVRSVYGNEHYYIADSIAFVAVSTLTGKKTIDKADMLALRALGHTLIQVLPPSSRKSYGSTAIPLTQPVDFQAIVTNL